jgi:hypothetical protein
MTARLLMDDVSLTIITTVLFPTGFEYPVQDLLPHSELEYDD